MSQTQASVVDRDDPPVSGRVTRSEAPRLRVDGVLAAVTTACCLGLLGYKFLLSTRLNINWDEFYFLSHVYSLLRGELDLLLLGAYTHLFTWLPSIGGDEIRQIVVARWIMLALLALTCWLIVRLGRLWLTGLASMIPCFVYLSAMPVVLHGGSFRFDSMLAPLSMAALLLLSSPLRRPWQDYAAGALLGVAFAISIKVVLFAPLYLAAVAFRGTGPTGSVFREPLEIVRTAIQVVVVGVGVAGSLLFLHSLSVMPTGMESLVEGAGAAANKTLLEAPWFPRIAFLEAYWRWQPLAWLLIAVGTALALVRRNFAVASLSLALLPIAFYRNAFPYYYVVMLAPAVILVGYAVQEITSAVRSKASAWVTASLLITIWLGLLYQGAAKLGRLFVDDQVVQQSLLSGIHQIFPEPVNYVDRCGMVPSFRKVNFFMSTWGMEKYRQRGEPFMPAAIRDEKPAFILQNVFALDPGSKSERGLLADDRDLIASYYPRYWGPVRVAGARVTIDSSGPVRVRVPFSDRYRIESDGLITIDGVIREDGEVITVPASGVLVEAARPESQPVATSMTLFLAAAGPRPSRDLPPWPLFAGL